MSKALDLKPGQKFGLWTVRQRAGRTWNGNALWECECVCGCVSRVRATDLTSYKSTGCRRCGSSYAPQQWTVSGDVATAIICGAVCTIDASDVPLVALHHWHLHKQREYTYACMVIGRHRVGMHQILLSDKRTSTRRLIDHVNGDTLDNRRSCNLRPASHAENVRNGRPRSGGCGYRGVYRVPSRRWCAHIKCNGKDHHLGIFDSPHDAARAYNAAAVELFGEFARVNPIREGEVDGAV